MESKTVLLIGMPFIYKLIDFNLLKRQNIEPLLTYQKDMQSIEEGISLHYDSLTIDEISSILVNTKVDAIVCFNDNFLVESAILRTKFNIQGIKFPEIEKFKIKTQMYSQLQPYMDVPQTLVFNEALSFRDIVKTFDQGEYFIKPDNRAGAEGSCHIRDESDYLFWKKNSYSHNYNYLLQQFYPHPLVHCELIVNKGNVLYVQARRYSYPNHLFLNGKIIASFPIENHEIRVKIEQEATKVAKHLGYINGVMHTEFFITEKQDLIFLETNIRQAGGAINLIHRRRAGISFETAMVLLELDRDVPLTLAQDNIYDIGGYIPIKQGKVEKITIPDLKGTYDFDIRVHLGDVCQSPTSASNASVSFVGTSCVYKDLTDDFCSIEKNGIIQYC